MFVFSHAMLVAQAMMVTVITTVSCASGFVCHSSTLYVSITQLSTQQQHIILIFNLFRFNQQQKTSTKRFVFLLTLPKIWMGNSKRRAITVKYFEMSYRQYYFRQPGNDDDISPFFTPSTGPMNTGLVFVMFILHAAYVCVESIPWI